MIKLNTPMNDGHRTGLTLKLFSVSRASYFL